MLNSIKIKNFRCFDEIEVEGFKRVNFVVGENASGKTSLLEGMFIGLQQNIRSIFELSTQRINISNINSPVDKKYNAYWSHLFKNYNIEQSFIIEFISFKNNNTKLLGSFSVNSITGAGESHSEPYNYFYIDVTNDLENLWERAYITRLGNIELGSGKNYIKSTFIQANMGFNNAQLVDMFSEFSIESKTAGLIQALQRIFPLIENLSIKVMTNPSIFAKYKYSEKPMPLTLISFGINKVFALFLFILKNKNGIVLIDEIENGLHVSILEKFWEVLYDLAVENNVQLFITSHSLECMNAAEKVIAEHPDDFAEYNMSIENGKIKAIRTKGQSLLNDIRDGYDFRL